MSAPTNPLVSDRDVAFLLYEVLDATRLCQLPAFADHSKDTFDMIASSVRRVAREAVYPTYKPMDEQPPEFRDGSVRVHPMMKEIYPTLVELGILTASRPESVGGLQLPMTVSTLANLYLMAANLGAFAYLGLTTGAAHLIEAFGDDQLKREVMARMYSGEWTGTMALTEPHAGSSLADITTSATPTEDGRYRVRGSKIFISGGDHDLTDNIVHLTLARIDGAPAGTKGISLFAIPSKRPQGEALIDNDVQTAGMIHKIGWRGLPSLILNFGERDDCLGWLVGEPNRGLRYMFQMMNEARIMVGANGVATASVAYHESLAYARARAQGRPPGAKNLGQPQRAIIEHADVRRMLLRQKAIVEGGMALLATTSMYADLAEHATDEEEKQNAGLLLDLLTPIAKTFPAEWGFEANSLAVQIHGGYGYSSEYLPESWLRDQKLNSIHEGTTGIQSLDLLGRRVVAKGLAPLQAFRAAVAATVARAHQAGVEASWCEKLDASVARMAELTTHLAGLGLRGDVGAMLRHSWDYLDLFATIAVAWQWLGQAAAAKEGLAKNPGSESFYRGKLCAAQYWLATELPRADHLIALCRANDDSYDRIQDSWF